MEVNSLSESDLSILKNFCINNTGVDNVNRESKEINKISKIQNIPDTITSVLRRITGLKNSISSFHTVTYKEGDYSLPHYDTGTEKSIVILLENCEQGGRLFINNKPIEFNKPGDWILFDGHKNIHYVSKVTKGIRKTLVCWFKKNTDLI